MALAAVLVMALAMFHAGGACRGTGRANGRAALAAACRRTAGADAGAAGAAASRRAAGTDGGTRLRNRKRGARKQRRSRSRDLQKFHCGLLFCFSRAPKNYALSKEDDLRNVPRMDSRFRFLNPR